jgi:hypothetical protein
MIEAVLDVIGNTEPDVLLGNVQRSVERSLPWFDFDESSQGSVCLVGGGPSLVDTIDQLRVRHQNGAKVWAMNGSYDYLVEQGIIPDAMVMLDARPENVRFVCKPYANTTFYITSQCDPSVFDALNGYKVVLVHANTPGVYELLEHEKARPVHLIGGFTTVGILSLILAKLQGFKRIFMFGMDSSYRNGEHHAYEQKSNDDERIIDAMVDDVTYKCAPWMAQKVTDFQNVVAGFDDVTIEVCGDGLLHQMAKAMSKST